MNPNISEAARRAAEAVKGEFPGSLFGVSVEDLVRPIKSALDSAHPARTYDADKYCPHLVPWDRHCEACAHPAPLNASSSNGPMGPPSGDGKGEVVATKEGETPETDKQAANYESMYGTDQAVTKHFARSLELRLAEKTREFEHLRDLCGPALAHSDCEIVALRERLQKAEELLWEAHRFLDCDYEVRVGALPARIRTFLNQDKT